MGIAGRNGEGGLAVRRLWQILERSGEVVPPTEVYSEGNLLALAPDALDRDRKPERPPQFCGQPPARIPVEGQPQRP